MKPRKLQNSLQTQSLLLSRLLSEKVNLAKN